MRMDASLSWIVKREGEKVEETNVDSLFTKLTQRERTGRDLYISV
jgi:hypothetical protein